MTLSIVGKASDNVFIVKKKQTNKKKKQQTNKKAQKTIESNSAPEEAF